MELELSGEELERIFSLELELIRDELERKAEKSALNLIDSIEKSKEQELYRLIFALGIRHIGQKAAKLLCDNLLTIENIMNSKVEDYTNIDGFGTVMAESIVEYFSHEESINLIKELKESRKNNE